LPCSSSFCQASSPCHETFWCMLPMHKLPDTLLPNLSLRQSFISKLYCNLQGFYIDRTP
jgi:hypothetical protein